jgi:uncharacterized membrane protein YgcG
VEIVLGVSMTPTTVRMVLVEGEKADGLTVDHDVFDITALDGAATSSAPDQVIAAILGTQESAASGGHHLVSTGVTWSDHAEAATLREALAPRRFDDVHLVSELHAAGALAQAVGRTVGYGTTALMFIERDAATLSVVETADGSIVKVDSQSLHSDDAMAVLSDMVASLQTHASQPEGMFVVGSGVDVASVKEHLEHLVSIPVSAPDEPELALARGAALAAAHAPRFDASTVGLAYSQDPDGTTAGEAYGVGLAAADTQMAPVGYSSPGADEPEVALAAAEQPDDAQEGRKPFMLVGSSLTGIFVVGVVALVISLAVSIRPTVDTRPSPGGNAIHPSTAAPSPPAVQDAQPVQQQPPPETIQAPVPVVQEQQAPRAVVVQAPKQAPPPAPEAPPPAPPPAAEPVPPPAGPPPGQLPAYPAPQYPPAYVPPAPIYVPPPVYVPPIIQVPPVLRPPRDHRGDYPDQKPPWDPPSQQPPWNPPSQQPQDRWNPPSQQPQSPPSQQPQTPQQPLWPPSGSGSSGSGSGGISSGGSGGSGSGGSGSIGSGGSGSGGGTPWWPWPGH